MPSDIPVFPIFPRPPARHGQLSARGAVANEAGRIIRGQVGAPTNPEPFIQYALRFLTALQEAAANLSPPEIAVSQIEVPTHPIFMGVERPDLEQISWTLPAMPTEFTGQLDVDGLLPEPFDDNPPVLVFGTAPEAQFGPLPAAPGVNLDLDLPDLVVSLPAPPPLIDITVSPFDGIQLPGIPDDAPSFDLVAPTIREYVPGAGYSSSLLTALRGELLRRIQFGGTGLNPDVEQAIWDRGREREATTLRDQLQDLDRMEGMGFTLPPGVWFDARLKVQTEHANRNMGLSREIMIKQAELELEGVNKALDLANSVEQVAIQQANNIEQRAFDAARYATEAGVAIYNAKVTAFGALVDVYRSKVTAYEARIRGELAKVEAYRTEIEAERLKTQINQVRVEQFKIQTDVALSAIEVYKAQIGGIQARAEMEKLKVQIFGEQVRSYGMQVNVFTAQVEAFRAGLQAETAKQETYRSSVMAYTARVDAGSKVIGARVAEFQARVSAKESEWRAFSSMASVEADRVRAAAGINEAVARMYGAEAGAVSSFNEVLGRQWSAQVQQSINLANITLEQAKANAQLYMLQQSMIMDAAKVGATVSAQMGAAALSANSFSTSFSNSRAVSASTGWSEGYSDSYSRSDSESTSTSTSYSYSKSEVKTLSV